MSCPECGAPATVQGTKKATERLYVRQMICGRCHHTFQAIGAATRHMRRQPNTIEDRIVGTFE